MAEPEDWQLQDQRDDELLEVEDILTEIDTLPNGKHYITINGIRALANKLKFKILNKEDLSNESEWAFLIEAINPEGLNRWGGASEKRSAAHALAKAIGKAIRNAFKPLLAGREEVEQALRQYEEEHGKNKSQRSLPQTKQQGQKKQQQQKQSAPKTETLEAAKNKAQDAITKHEARLSAVGISKAELWKRALTYLKIKSEKDMNVQRWNEIHKGVSATPLKDWVLQKQVEAA